MFSILLISHGPLAQAMVKSAGMVGGHDGRAHAIEIDRDTKKEHLKEQIRKKITELLALGAAVVLTDIPLGTPFNTVVSLMGELDFIHLTGMNLSMVIELFLASGDEGPLEEAVRGAIAGAKEKILHVNDFLSQVRNQAEEDEGSSTLPDMD